MVVPLESDPRSIPRPQVPLHTLGAHHLYTAVVEPMLWDPTQPPTSDHKIILHKTPPKFEGHRGLMFEHFFLGPLREQAFGLPSNLGILLKMFYS